jgi:hypothetical protein
MYLGLDREQIWSKLLYSNSSLLQARRDAKLVGIRAKKIKEAAEETENTPGAKAKAKK